MRMPGEILTEVVTRLSEAPSLPTLTSVVASAAREIAGADGATFVLRDGDLCHYADEDAISPLWKGSRFPMEMCISGVSMLTGETIVIPDITLDSRIPQDAYRPTFVKSLCMMPIRPGNALGAIGNYWKDGRCPSAEQVKLLQILANSTAVALENLELRHRLVEQASASAHLPERLHELETAIQMMAHDLKNPLGTMMLFAEVLQNKLWDQLDEKTLGYFKSIRQTGMRASEQIQKMLSLSGVTRRKLEPSMVNLSEMGLEIAENLQNQSPGRFIQFEIAPAMRATADPVLTRLALENILSNAVKYTGKRERTLIEFKQDSARGGSFSTFFIRDNGVGFDPDQGNRLFRPLVRLHDDSDFPGNGLGLASAARIIELHGGKIRAEGQVDRGAAFYFDLPRTA